MHDSAWTVSLQYIVVSFPVQRRALPPLYELPFDTPLHFFDEHSPLHRSFDLTSYLTPRGISLPSGLSPDPALKPLVPEQIINSYSRPYTTFQTLLRPRRPVPDSLVVLSSLRPRVLRSSRKAPTTTSFLIGPSSNTGASTCT